MVPQTENLGQLLQHWRLDALEFLRSDAPRILLILIEAFIFIWLLRLVRRKVTTISRVQTLPAGVRAQQVRTLSSVVYGVGLFVIIFQAALQTLGVVNINIGPLLASAGIAGLAIGFGAQTLVKDVINGFFILMENQYDVGDTVRMSGVQGTVEHMTLRRTVLRDADGALHIIPNSEIKIVSNLTRDWAQVALHVNVAYSESSDRIIGLLKEIGREVRNDPFYADMLVSDPEVPGIERVAGTEVDYLMLAKTRPGQQYAVTRELRRRIKESFEKNNIQHGSPGQVYVLDSTSKPQP